jgi:Flp pilus assembly protein CpaB
MANPSELTQKLPPTLGSGKFLSTRRGTITLAALAALAALGVLLMFMNNYRSSVQSGASDARVLVADRFIDKGTSGDAIAEAGLFQAVTITDDDAVEGAVTDPSAIAGQVLTEPVTEGQQLSAAAFAPGADPIAGKLEGTMRAISVPVDEARGNIGQVSEGSRVDVLGSLNTTVLGGRAAPTVEVLARDILVLRVPETESSGPGGEDDDAVVLRVTDTQASRIAYGADAGDIWLTVRPPTLGEDSKVKDSNYTGSAGAGLIDLLGG